jgi:hypothetical protein
MLETLMLTPIRQPLPQDLQDRGYHILATLPGLGAQQQLNLACRTLLAMFLLRRPSASAPKTQRDAFKTLCTGVQVWLREEIAEIQHVRPTPKISPRRSKPRPKVGHA